MVTNYLIWLQNGQRQHNYLCSFVHVDQEHSLHIACFKVKRRFPYQTGWWRLRSGSKLLSIVTMHTKACFNLIFGITPFFYFSLTSFPNRKKIVQTFDFLILKLNMHERRNCTGWNSQGYSLLRWRQWQGYMSGKNYKALFFTTQLALVIFMQQCRLTLLFKGDSGGALVCRIHPFSEAQREIQCKGLYLQGNIL